jgi:hypothetical protein
VRKTKRCGGRCGSKIIFKPTHRGEKKSPKVAGFVVRVVFAGQDARAAFYSMSDFAAACATAMQKDGVIGVVCVDANGLVLHTEGTVPQNCGGSVAELASRGLVLAGDGAVVTAESPTGKLLVSRSEGVTIAMFMRPKGE